MNIHIGHILCLLSGEEEEEEEKEKDEEEKTVGKERYFDKDSRLRLRDRDSQRKSDSKQETLGGSGLTRTSARRHPERVSEVGLMVQRHYTARFYLIQTRQ